MHAFRPLFLLALLAPAAAAQSVLVTVSAGKMTIKGSPGIDLLAVSGSRADGGAPPALDIVITPDGDTTVNGSAFPGLFTEVTSVKVLLGGGADLLELENFAGPDFPLTVNAGPGDDEVRVTDSTAGAFKYVGAAGRDVLVFDTATLGDTHVTDTSGEAVFAALGAEFGALAVKTGASDDELTWTDVDVTGKLAVTLGGGADQMIATNLAVSAAASVKSGGDGDGVTFIGCGFGGGVALVLGGGNDLVDFEGSAVASDLDIKLGGGANLLAVVSEDASVLVGGSVTVKGSPDNDVIALFEGSDAFHIGIGEDLRLDLKSGMNQLDQNGDVSVSDDLLLTAGALADSIDIDGLHVGHDATFLLASGTNELILDDCLIGNDLTVTTGPDDDTVQLTGTTAVGGTQTINLGGGET